MILLDLIYFLHFSVLFLFSIKNYSSCCFNGFVSSTLISPQSAIITSIFGNFRSIYRFFTWQISFIRPVSVFNRAIILLLPLTLISRRFPALPEAMFIVLHHTTNRLNNIIRDKNYFDNWCFVLFFTWRVLVPNWSRCLHLNRVQRSVHLFK